MPLDYMRSSRERYRSPRALVATSRSLAFRKLSHLAVVVPPERRTACRGVLWRSKESECRLRNRRLQLAQRCMTTSRPFGRVIRSSQISLVPSLVGLPVMVIVSPSFNVSPVQP
jgi:hypothetical protein